MKIIGLIIAYSIIVLIDFPLLKPKSKHKLRLILTYGTIVLLGFIISLLQLLKMLPVSLGKLIEIIMGFRYI